MIVCSFLFYFIYFLSQGIGFRAAQAAQCFNHSFQVLQVIEGAQSALTPQKPYPVGFNKHCENILCGFETVTATLVGYIS